MIIERIYTYNREDYKIDGFNKHNNELFSDFIKECEADFHNQTLIFFANCMFANDSTMILIKNCFAELNPNEDFGMDLIEGEIDLDTNLKIEEYSRRKTTYAIGSGANEDEPLFLIIDDKIRDGKFILKYIPDDDNEEDIETEPPIEIHGKDYVPLKSIKTKYGIPIKKLFK